MYSLIELSLDVKLILNITRMIRIPIHQILTNQLERRGPGVGERSEQEASLLVLYKALILFNSN